LTKSSGAAELPVAELDRECRTFCRYLAGRNPSAYVIEKYVEFHRVSGALAHAPAFEQALVRIAARHTWLARMADSYSARFAKCSVLRKKLALMVGLLECSPGFHEALDTAWQGPKILVFLRMGLAVAASAGALAASVALLGPLHVFLREPRSR
jgi:hypothetical protein